MSPTIMLSIEHDDLVVSVRGDLDLAAHPLMREVRGRLAPTGPHGLVLDLSDVGFVDCAGVRMLGQLMRSWLADGRDAVVVCPEGPVARVLRLTGFTRQFVVVPAFLLPAGHAVG